MIFNGTYHDGAIFLDENAPFTEGEKIRFEIVENGDSLPQQLTVDKIRELTERVNIRTAGWKFNREEANER